jgi:hypothetical protein
MVSLAPQKAFVLESSTFGNARQIPHLISKRLLVLFLKDELFVSCKYSALSQNSPTSLTAL